MNLQGKAQKSNYKHIKRAVTQLVAAEEALAKAFYWHKKSTGEEDLLLNMMTGRTTEILINVIEYAQELGYKGISTQWPWWAEFKKNGFENMSRLSVRRNTVQEDTL